MTRRVFAPSLASSIERAFMAGGLPAGDAATISALMVEADLIGADAHGVFRLPQYIRRIEGGAVNRTPAITVRKTAAATALVDGDNGMGHLVVSRAAATIARRSSVCGSASTPLT